MIKQKILSFLTNLDAIHLAKGLDVATYQELEDFLTTLTNYGPALLKKQQDFLHTKSARSLKLATPPLYTEQHNLDPKIGLESIAKGEVACVILAGGLASRLGSSLPKGMIPVSPIQHKSLFQILLEKINVLSHQYNRVIPIAIITSTKNIKETTSYLEKHEYFGLGSQISVVCQENLPFLSESAQWCLEKPAHLAEGPCGNGKTFSLLEQEGILKRWAKLGIKYIQVTPIDNPLADPCDMDLIGLMKSQNHDITIKAIEREDPLEPMGLLVNTPQGIQVIEYSDLSLEEKIKRTDTQELFFPLANTGILSFSLAFINRCLEKMDQLPFHLAFKQAPLLTLNGISSCWIWKFEYFIFDLLALTSNVGIVKSKRLDCFSPLKNATGANSLQTVQKDLISRYKKIYSELSGLDPLNDFFELDPLFWYPTAELKNYWKGRPLPKKSYVEPFTL